MEELSTRTNEQRDAALVPITDNKLTTTPEYQTNLKDYLSSQMEEMKPKDWIALGSLFVSFGTFIWGVYKYQEKKMEKEEKEQKELQAKIDREAKEEAEKIKESYKAGEKETLDSFVKATGLKWKGRISAELLGQNYRMVWDSERNLAAELKTKEGIISEKDAEICGLNVRVTTLTEENNGLRYQLTLVDAKAIDKLNSEKAAETARADKAEKECSKLLSMHKRLLDQWNAVKNEPEFLEAVKLIHERKERKASLLDSFIREGREELQNFARTTRLMFSEREARYIYYGIVAIAAKFTCLPYLEDSLVRRFFKIE